MNAITHPRTTRSRTTGPLGAVGVLVLCGLAATGCSTSDAGPGSSATAPAAARSAAASAPTLAELQDALDLTGEETAALAPLVENWQDAIAARGGPGYGPPPGRGGAGRGQGARGQGRGFRGGSPCDGSGPGAGGRPGAGRGAGLGPDPSRMPPGATFLVDAAEVLDLQKTGDLVTWMSARAEARAADREARQGDRPGPGRGRGGAGLGGAGLGLAGPGLGLHLRGALCELDLDRADLGPLRDAMRDLAGEVGDALRGYADDEVTVDGVRDRADAAVSAFETAAAEVLDEAGLQTLDAAIASARADHANRALDMLETRTARRQQLLTRVLELDEAQVGQVATILATASTAETTLLTGIADGSVALPEALHTGLGLAETTRSDISAVLTEAQQTVFESLRGLGPRGFHRLM